MNPAYLLLSFALGLGVGVLVAWVIFRARAASPDQETALLRAERDRLAEESCRLGEEARAQSNLRAGAEERAKRVPGLEAELSAAREAKSSSEAELSGLRVTLEKERKATEEKLGLLETAQKQLSDAFKALSSEALRHNNESFLNLAKASLGAWQQQA